MSSMNTPGNMLQAPVAQRGDRDLDLGARERRQVDLELLPAARAAVGGVPDAARAGRAALPGRGVERLVVRQERVQHVRRIVQVAPAARARLVVAQVVRGVPVQVGQRRPVILPDGVGLDDQVVEVLLEVEARPEGQSRAPGRHIDRVAQALVGLVRPLRPHERISGVRIEWTRQAAQILGRRPAVELREAVLRVGDLEEVAGRDERRVGVLVLSAVQTVDGPVQAAQRVVDPGDREGITGYRVESAPGGRDRRAEHVLDRVALRVARAEQRQAACLDRLVRAALLVLERVVELAAERRRVLLPGELARVEHASALVDEVAHLEQLLHRETRGVARTPARLARHDVVARVPEHGVVVAEHAEVVRRGAAVGVDVVDVEVDAERRERVLVEREVLR